jgi:hypothetical protein
LFYVRDGYLSELEVVPGVDDDGETTPGSDILPSADEIEVEVS